MARGKTLDEADNITWKQATQALGGLPAIKTHCSVLAVDGLRSAIQNYRERNGLVTERVPTTEEVVRKRLKHVMNPMVGLDLIRTKLVEKVEVENGTVRVALKLSDDHQFAANIREEILEKIEHLWDVQQVEVEFTE
jgi:metal-sulfur cluster biosynthetic enzyme